MEHLNIGILAHVDAGKTSLTERLLHHVGVIDHLGRVDTGDTQTDSMAIERRRGITIRSAVVSFVLGDVRVNLIDTPGHPDFIAEVERALRVLDGVVLVVSAVEGVQPQTRVLMRALKRLRLPVLIFVNKIDRNGARDGSLLADLTERLGVTCVPMSRVDGIGTSAARAHPLPVDPETLAEHSDAFLAAYLSDEDVDVRAELARQTQAGTVSPVFFGSARTGEGVAELSEGIRELLAGAPKPVPDDRLRATVFKIDPGKVAYVRMFSGSLGARDHVADGKVTSVRVFSHGQDTVEARARAGQIAKISGLKGIRIGDRLGVADEHADARYFPPPSLETVVCAADNRALYAALRELAEQDPLIDVRQSDEITVRLYGEVQKEVIAETLAEQHGLAVEFADTRPVCVERPVGIGESVWEMGQNPYVATVGLRVEPGAGVTYGLEVELGALPLSFHTAIEESARASLQRGPHGWEVVDIAIAVIRTAYSSPVSVAGDFRGITPLVLREALERAGTEVLEPISSFELEVPADTVSATLSRLIELGGMVTESTIRDNTALLGGTLPTGHVHRFSQQLPGLTHGEGALSTEAGGYQPLK